MKKISLIATTCLALAFAGTASAATHGQDGVSGGNGGNSNFSDNSDGFSGGNANAITNAFTYRLQGRGDSTTGAFLDMQQRVSDECVAANGTVTNISIAYFATFGGVRPVRANGTVTCETRTP